MKTLSFFIALVRTSIQASISNRGAFLLECLLMMANNFIFLLLWWIFFQQFKTVGGWTMRDMIVLNAIGIGAYGVMQVCFGGVKYIGHHIIAGDLDPFMTQPKNLLLHLISSRSQSKGWGMLLTTSLLIVLGGLASSLPLILLGMITGAFVFAAVGIFATSLVFWLGPVQTVSKKYFDSVYLFALYPTNIYPGLMQLVMFTVIPAGIIGYLPVELVRSFCWSKLFILIGASGGFFVFAAWVFYRGLKRYESGNQFGIKG